ncbi:hypothetical protein F5884DRAFT_754217 [Xylogone sp. PMI_703]|nr:hypothetical protein F5884DRAFT_754217 [Xylogone sp. PMI_703]
MSDTDSDTKTTNVAQPQSQNQGLQGEQDKKPASGQDDYAASTVEKQQRAAEQPDFMKTSPGNPPRVAAQLQDEYAFLSLFILSVCLIPCDALLGSMVVVVVMASR